MKKDDMKNPFEGKRVIFVPDENDPENADGVRGHLEIIGDAEVKFSFYEDVAKRFFDIVLSAVGLVLISPILLIVSIAIWIDDPGPVIFSQKRIGKNKKYFKLYKFRSMKMSTPHDKPTHMLDNPDQYITKVGRFIRAHSIDELPQLWNCLKSDLSLVSSRPALWNQDMLVAERDKYGVNEHRPGITGWAQINGRDAIEISEKARLDGEYIQRQSLLFDIRCLVGTVSKIGRDETVVEGGTGAMKEAGDHTK